MSPDSPQPTRQRRAWRFLACLGCVLAAFSLLVSVWLNQQIQGSRVEAVRVQCEATNDRHQRTIDRLNELIDKLPPGPRKRRARESYPGTVVLIDALVPVHHDCESYARSVVTPPPAPGS